MTFDRPALPPPPTTSLGNDNGGTIAKDDAAIYEQTSTKWS